jgi:hypothetical protein
MYMRHHYTYRLRELRELLRDLSTTANVAVQTVLAHPQNHDSHPLARVTRGKQLERVTRGQSQ